MSKLLARASGDVAARRRPLAAGIRASLLASAGVLAAQGAFMETACAGPEGGAVVAGQGRISAPDAATTLIQQGSHALAIDWQTFNVKSNERVQFNQPSSSAAVLNRVLNQTPSQIFGAVRANGQVFILNAGGVVIGPNARVNVGGLFVSSLDIRTEDFMAGRYRFEARDGVTPGAIVNRGLIEAASGGSVSLVGGQVANEGVIVADMGQVNLAAGRTATVDFDGDGLIRFQVDGEVLANPGGADAAVSNSGEIRAEGGRVLLSARAASEVFDRAVNNAGLIRAGGIRRVGGKVLLAGLGAGVRNTGTIDASGASGGSVQVVSDTGIEHRGTITADGGSGAGGVVTLDSPATTLVAGDSITSARSGQGNGGTVAILGERVAVYERARVDASGATGGGRVMVGGDVRGANPAHRNAGATFVGPDARLSADATGHGDGGVVVAWADGVTRAHGALSARGGVNGGDGGLIETSGKVFLDVSDVRIDASAPGGRGGTWLLDPFNISIQDAPATTTPVANGLPNFAADQNSVILTNDIESALNGGSDVTITTSDGAGGGVENGDITVDGAIEKTGGGNRTLRLDAAGTITLNSLISSSAGTLGVTLTANDNTGGAAGQNDPNTAAGDVIINAPVTTLGGTFTASGVNVSSTVAGIVTTDAAPASGGAGGAVDMEVATAVSLAGAVSTRGDGNGAGGTVNIDAGTGNVALAAIDASGGAGAGASGGAVDINTGGGAGNVVLNGNITSAGAAVGGDITVTRPTLPGANITLSTGTASGGNISLGTVAAGIRSVTLESGVGGNVTVASFLGGLSSSLNLQNVGGTAAVTGNLIVGTLSVPATVLNAAFTGAAGTVNNAVAFANTGTLTLGTGGGVLTFDSGIDTTAVTGTVTVNGTIRAPEVPIVMGAVTLGSATTLDTQVAATPASITLGTVTAGANTLTLATGNVAGADVNAAGFTGGAGSVLNLQDIGGTATFTGAVIADTLSVPGTVVNAAFTGDGSSILNAVAFANTGTLTLGRAAGTQTYNAGVTTTGVGGVVTLNGAVATSDDAITLGAVSLGSATTLDTNATTTAGDVTVGAVTAGGNALNIETGAGIAGADATGTTFTGGAGSALNFANVGGSAVFSGIVTAATMSTAATVANASFVTDGNALTGAATFANTGTLALGTAAGSQTYGGGITATAPSATTLNGTFSTSNDAIAFGAVTLGSAVTLDTAATSAAGTIGLGAVTAGNNSLTLATGNAIPGADVSGTTFTGGAGSALNLQNIGGSVTFSGAVTAQTVSVPASVVNAAFTGSGGTVTNAVVFANSGTLALGQGGGTQVFDGGIDSTGVGSVVTVNGNIATSNDAISMNAVTLGSATTLDSNATTATGVITVGAVTGGGNDLTLETGNGVAGASVTLASASSLGALLVRDVGGTADFNGAVSATSATVTGSNRVDLQALTTSGAIGVTATTVNVDGTLITTGGAGGSVSLNGATVLSAGITTAGGAVTLGGGAVTLASATTLIDTSNAGAAPTGAGITLNGALDGDAGGTRSLDLLAGTGGVVDINAAVGGLQALQSFTVRGGAGTIRAAQADLAAITTSNGDITISANVIDVPAVLTTQGMGAGLLSINGGGINLTASPVVGATSITLNGNPGAGADLTIGAALTSANSISLTTSRDIFVRAPIRTTGAGADITLTADSDNSGDGGVRIEAAGAVESGRNAIVTGSDLSATVGPVDAVLVDADPGNNQIDAGRAAAGSIQLLAGAGAPVGADIIVNGVLTTATNAGGTITLDARDRIELGANVSTSGAAVTFSDAVLLTADVVVTAGAGAVGFDAAVDGGQALTVNSASGTTFGGAVGGTTALASLTTDAAGTTAINGGAVRTTGVQVYNDGVTLGADTAITNGGLTTFAATVSGGGLRSLSLTGDVDASQAITGLTAFSVGGASALRADVTASGTQVYTGAVTLSAGNRVLTGSTVNFGNTVDGGGNALTVAGGANIDNAVSNVSNFRVTQATDLGGNVTTTGTQDYVGAVTLSGGARQVDAGAANITFAGTLDGGQDFTVNTTGATVFSGTVGGATPLASLATNAGGSTAINGGGVTTANNQTYRDPVTLAGAATLRTNNAAGVLDVTATSGLTTGGALALVTDNLTLAGNVAAGGQIVTVDRATAGLLTLGTDTANQLGLSSAELDRITAGIVRVGTLGAPINTAINIAAAINPLNTTILALRSTGAVTGNVPVTIASFGVQTSGASPITFTNAGNAVTNVALVTGGGDVQFTQAGAINVATVDGIAGVSAGAANAVTLAAGGPITQVPGASVVAATLTTTSNGSTLLNASAGNQVATFNATNTGAGGTVALADSAGGLDVSGIAAGGASVVVSTLGGNLTQSGTITGGGTLTASALNNTVTLGGANAMTGFSASTGAAGGGVTFNNSAATLALGNVTSGGLDLDNAGAVRVDAAVATNGGTLDIAATGSISSGGGSLTPGGAAALVLTAGGGIGSAGAALAAVTGGTLTLTSGGAAGAGDIVLDDDGFSTSQLRIDTSAVDGQRVILGGPIVFDTARIAGSNANDTVDFNGAATVTRNIASAGTGLRFNTGAVTLGPAVSRIDTGAGVQSYLGGLTTPAAGLALVSSNTATGVSMNTGVRMVAGAALDVAARLTLLGATTFGTDLLNLGGAVSGGAGTALSVLPVSAGKVITVGAASDPLFSAANLGHLAGLRGALNVGGTATAIPAPTLADVSFTGALNTTGDVTVVSGNNILFQGGAINTSGVVTLIALGKPGVADSGNILDNNPAATGPSAVTAATLVAVANNKVGSDVDTEGGALNVSARIIDIALGADTAFVNNTVGGAVVDNSASARITALFADAFGSSVSFGNTVQGSFETIDLEQNTDFGFIDDGVFLLPPTYTSAQRALLLPVLGDPDFPGDLRPDDPDDEAAWLAFFEDVVLEFIIARYPLPEDAGAEQRAAVDAVVAAEMQTVMDYYGGVRARLRAQIAAEAAASAAGQPDPASAAPAAPIRQGALPLPAPGFGFVGQDWARGGLGVEVRGRAAGSGIAWPRMTRPQG